MPLINQGWLVQCDGCGENLEYVALVRYGTTKRCAETYAKARNWAVVKSPKNKQQGTKTYCPDCWEEQQRR